MAKLITVYWRDIPAQVIVKQGRRTAKVQLPERFQEAIDRAAMRAEVLQASIDDDMLAAMIRGKGRRPAADD